MSLKAKRILILIGLIILVVVAVFYIKSRNGLVKVRSVDVEKRIVRKTVSASGEIKSDKEVDLGFPTVGEITTINVKIGDTIAKGTLIATIFSYDLAQSARAYKEALDASTRDKEIFIEDYSTNLDGIGGEDEYKLRLKKYKDLEEKARANYESALGSLSKTNLSTPFDGTVLDIYKEVGEIASIAGTVFKFADVNNLYLEIELDQEDFGELKEEQTAEVILDAYEDKVFSGTVRELPQFVDPTSEEFIIKIRLNQDKEAPILLGMEGDVDIIVNQTDSEVNSLLFDAVFGDEEGAFVWTLANERIKKERIQVGLEGDIYIEITTDLTNKRVVVPLDQKFEEGMKAQVE